MSDDLTNITQIWDVFFFPVLDSALVYLFLRFLLGRENILRYAMENSPAVRGVHIQPVLLLDRAGGSGVKGNIHSASSPAYRRPTSSVAFRIRSS